MTPDKEEKDFAAYLADKIINRFPDVEFDYNYLVGNILEAISNSIK